MSRSLKELQETFKNTKEKDEAGGRGGVRGGGGWAGVVLENCTYYNTYQPCQVLSNLLGKITYLDLLKFEDRQNMQTSDQKGS